MRSTKSSLSSSVLVSRTLKTFGVVSILATLFDIGIGAVPYNFSDQQWQMQFTTQLVDRGVVSMVGIVLFLTGFWIDGTSDNATERKSLFLEPRFWAFIFSSILGAMFLLMFPLHLSNVGWSNQQNTKAITDLAKQNRIDLDNELNQKLNLQRAQIAQLLNLPAADLEKLVNSGQLPTELVDNIPKFKADPKAINPFLAQYVKQAKDQFLTQINSKEKKDLTNAQRDSLKSGLRIGMGSLLLAAGFIVIGWMGLRTLGQL
jgi:hypothetical protein